MPNRLSYAEIDLSCSDYDYFIRLRDKWIQESKIILQTIPARENISQDLYKLFTLTRDKAQWAELAARIISQIKQASITHTPLLVDVAIYAGLQSTTT